MGVFFVSYQITKKKYYKIYKTTKKINIKHIKIELTLKRIKLIYYYNWYNNII